MMPARTVIYCLMLCAAFSAIAAGDNEIAKKEDGAVVETFVALPDAVTALNKEMAEYPFDRPAIRIESLPKDRRPAPLTVNEVAAAIRQWDRKKIPVDDSTFQIFQNIAASKVLPPAAKLRFSCQWFDEDNKDKYEYRVWWIDLDVMTGENRLYRFRIRDQRLQQRIALRPDQGFDWVVSPMAALRPGKALANGGLVYFMEEDRDEALIVIVSRQFKPGGKELRVVAFDEQGNRHELPGRRMASLKVNTDHESIIERFRLDPQKLPRDKVEFVGFEASVAPENNPPGKAPE